MKYQGITKVMNLYTNIPGVQKTYVGPKLKTASSHSKPNESFNTDKSSVLIQINLSYRQYYIKLDYMRFEMKR